MAFILPTPEQQAAEKEIVGVVLTLPDDQSFTLNCKVMSQAELEAIEGTKTQLLSEIVVGIDGVLDASGNLVTDIAPVLQFLGSKPKYTEAAIAGYFLAIGAAASGVKAKPAGNRRPLGASRSRS